MQVFINSLEYIYNLFDNRGFVYILPLPFSKIKVVTICFLDICKVIKFYKYNCLGKMVNYYLYKIITIPDPPELALPPPLPVFEAPGPLPTFPPVA